MLQGPGELERQKAYEELRLALEENERLKNRLHAENIYLQEEIRREHNFEEIVGSSAPLIEALRKVEQVAPTDSTVLVFGETGTGKELIARAIHNLSARASRPLVKVNCGAISAGLVESELFGHVKGAFTGAIERRVGRFELADKGTLFLDEVSELPMETQVKLLRVLQEGEFEPVGSSRTVRINVRIIAATNRSLEEAVREGRFRSDLFYRLNVVQIYVPALRERRADIPQLVMFFLSRFAKKFGKKIEQPFARDHRHTRQLLLAGKYPRASKHNRARSRAFGKLRAQIGQRFVARAGTRLRGVRKRRSGVSPSGDGRGRPASTTSDARRSRTPPHPCRAHSVGWRGRRNKRGGKDS